MRTRRRNPDILGTIVLLGGLGVGGYFAYQFAKGKLAGQSPTASSIGYQGGSSVGTAAGSAAAGAVSGAANGVLLDGQDICSLIATWRAYGSPVFSPGFNIAVGGGDPHNYQNFVTYATYSAWGIAPATPPACW